MKKVTSVICLLTCLIFAAQAQGTSPDSDTTIYKFVEKMPEFPGGIEALNQYLITHVTYPTAARDAGAEGMVLVEFVVEKDGSVSNVQTVVSAHPALDEEAMRVVRGLPKWTPGEASGKKIRVYFNLPIRFQLDPSSKKKHKKAKNRR